MTDSPLTRATLVFRLRDRTDDVAWSQFIEMYGPMIYRFARSRGLQDADASDVVQDVFRRVGNAIDRLDYAKEKGGFRAWLFAITRNCLVTYFEKKQRTGPTGNDTAQYELLQQEVDGQNELEERWEREHQRQLMGHAMELIKGTTESKAWQAFELTAIEGVAADVAGEKIGMSRGAVYVAKSRVIAKLRAEVERMMEDEL